MGTPISFNSGTTSSYVTGVFKRASIGLNLATALAANTNWWNGVDVSNSQYLIYSDIYSQGQSSFSTSRPTAWTTPDLNDSSLILLINTLPDRVGLPGFTTVSQAVNWLNQTGKYFLLKLGYDNIVTSNIKLRMDAGWYNSYPGSGSVWTDLSANAYSATLYNGPVFVGVDNGVLDFDGANDYGSFGTAIVPAGSSPYTVIVWVKRGRNNVGYEEVLAQWTFAGSGNSFYLGFDSGNVRFTDSWSTITGVYGAEKVNEWMCLVGVNTGSNAYIYLNGVLMATKGSALTYSATGPLVIGRQGELNGEYFDGQIGLIQVYDVALNSTQILQNFNAQAYRFGLYNNLSTSGLVLYNDAKNVQSYPGSGTAWFDLSGNDNITTLFNGPTFNSIGFITFDGTNDYGKNANTPVGFNFNSTNAMSAEAIINYNPSDFDFWFSANQGGIKYRFGTNSSGNFYWDMGQHVDKNFGGYVLPSGTWNHVVFTGGIENGTIRTRVYSNGVLITTENENITSLTSIDEFFIGTGESQFAHPFNGSINSVRIYNRALSASDVLSNYYGGNIVTSGLQLLLDAGNMVSYGGSGTTWKDISPNNYDGVLTNGPTFSNSNGGSLVFDGTNDYVLLTHAETPITNLSYEIFVKIDSIPASNTFRSIWQKSENWNNDIGISLQMIYGSLTFSYGSSWGGSASCSLSLLSTGNWYHIVGTVSATNGSNPKLYLNGVYVGGGGYSSTPTTTSDLTLGLGNGGVLLGNIAIFKCYNKELNPIEIQQNFNAYKSRYGL